MGLSIAHGIVKNYGGFISFYSELGEGTVFHVFLPTLEKEALTGNEVNDQIPLGRERILFVDDEEILTQMGIKEFAFKPLAKKDIAKLIRKVLDIS
ncbi:MAG: two-component system cell cycle sensor histidine kinase/response regulator CckA [Desulforhopalus sp.]|jgi:two-component system cell cycle sensor histidine kinase/response regulator CckA